MAAFIMLIIIGFLYLFFCWSVGLYAEQMGRSKGDWFVISIIINPFLSYLIVAILGKTVSKQIEEQEEYNALQSYQSLADRWVEPEPDPTWWNNEKSTNIVLTVLLVIIAILVIISFI